MSVLQYPEALHAQNLQIYENAAFDDASYADPSAIKDSWIPLQPISINRLEALESDSCKENRSPVSTKSSLPMKPISQGKPLKLLFKQGLLDPPPEIKPEKIDNEIEEIEKEIHRLSSRLEALRIEKAVQDPNPTRRQSVGRIVPAKFMEQKQSAKKMEESPASFRRRGVSLGPSEIATAVRFRQPDKSENRRKSCFWKLPEIEEEKVRKERGRNLSLSPKSRPSVRKIPDPRRGISTVGSKKPVKRDPATLTGLQPKTLFKDGTAASNKASKNSRIVPSRYGQTIHQTLQNEKEESKKRTRGHLSCIGRTPATENRAKRKWEIPVEARGKGSAGGCSPSAILKMADELPKIKTVRCGSWNGSPRDSGPAKRVADLIGRKSYFDGEEGDKEKLICQVLEFEEEE